ncbi:MAG TPA: 2-hydroxychromene-2-carboxylate isomerase [Steroidobacteraceae bacterium]|jgi:2-hydroxychromene-2-carboxylate isomerase|nr:2-hydroxychromene-2-carboxylate isomerase [Steroidobacteraceae bacterium]
MRQVIWYFDFISPYSYFGLFELERLGAGVRIEYRPVLFAGLLNHWGQRGPAEIPGKRTWTYRWCTWYAAQHGIAFKLPAAHPFNPLGYLRLAIAANAAPSAIRTIFERLWTTGSDPTDARMLEELATSLGIAREQLAEPRVKESLRANADAAIAQGVFGVPSLVIDGEVFWGADATDFARAYLADASVLDNQEMKRVSSLPVGATRV